MIMLPIHLKFINVHQGEAFSRYLFSVFFFYLNILSSCFLLKKYGKVFIYFGAKFCSQKSNSFNYDTKI